MIKLSSTISLFQTCNQVGRVRTSNRNIFTCYSALFNKDDTNDPVKDNLEKKKTDISKKKEVEKKLEDLLLQMSKVTTEPTLNVRIPRPRPSGKKKYEERKAEFNKDLERKEKEKLGYRLGKAAENVADSLGGDKKKTESELLNLYLFGKTSGEQTERSSDEKITLSNLLTSMKVEKETEPSRANQVRAYRDNRPDEGRAKKIRFGSTISESIDIFGEIPFNFFTPKSEEEKTPPTVLNTWNYLHERDLRLCVTHPPRNIFEQLVQWTDEGKLWRFPIDNEQDWPEEPDVDFTEHVFLEPYIEPWCPKSGPIRHFMELVCTGLSKNPYMTVADKRAHISFYENYFRSKNAVLAELGIPKIPEKLEQMAID